MSLMDHQLAARHALYAADTISAGAIVGSFMGYLPPLAAGVAILWYAIQIWESKTVQMWLRYHRRHRWHRKVRERAVASRVSQPK